MTSNRDIVGRLGSIAEGEEDAEAQRDADDAGVLHRRQSASSDPAQVYSVRIPIDRLAQLRRAANQRGTTPSALLRDWMIERLDADLADGEMRDDIQAAVAAAALVLEQHLRRSSTDGKSATA